MPRHIPNYLIPLLLPLLFLSQIRADYWTVDRSPSDYAPKDVWWTGCQNRTRSEERNDTLVNTITTQACLDWYYWGGIKDNWQGTTCNNLGWFRGTADNYGDGAACYEKCYGCLSQSVQAGATSAICRDGHGYSVVDILMGKAQEPSDSGPNCWIGFAPL